MTGGNCPPFLLRCLPSTYNARRANLSLIPVSCAYSRPSDCHLKKKVRVFLPGDIRTQNEEPERCSRPPTEPLSHYSCCTTELYLQITPLSKRKQATENDNLHTTGIYQHHPHWPPTSKKYVPRSSLLPKPHLHQRRHYARPSRISRVLVCLRRSLLLQPGLKLLPISSAFTLPAAPTIAGDSLSPGPGPSNSRVIVHAVLEELIVVESECTAVPRPHSASPTSSPGLVAAPASTASSARFPTAIATATAASSRGEPDGRFASGMFVTLVVVFQVLSVELPSLWWWEPGGGGTGQGV